MAHTATQMHPAVGQTVLIAFHPVAVQMKIVDVKSAWGKVRLMVTPVAGTGAVWVDSDRLVAIVHPANTLTHAGTQRGKQ